MSLTPQDVEQQVFRERRRGYDPEEVDKFLDEVSASLAALIQERDRTRARITELEQSSDSARESENLLRRTLISAERTAEQTVTEAQQEAQGIREEARRYAAETAEAAEADAAQLRRTAEQEAAELRRRAEEETAELRRSTEEETTELRTRVEREAAELRRAVEEEVAREREFASVGADRVRRAVMELQNFRDEYRDRVQSVIAEQLSALDRVGDLPDLSPALEQIAQLPAEEDDSTTSYRG